MPGHDFFRSNAEHELLRWRVHADRMPRVHEPNPPDEVFERHTSATCETKELTAPMCTKIISSYQIYSPGWWTMREGGFVKNRVC
jgi:hypothetical protein